MHEMDILKRQLERERLARKASEQLLESKARELFESNQNLIAANQLLEELVKSRTEQLNQEKNQLFTIFEQHPLPTLLTSTHDNIIIEANSKALELFDCSIDDLRGKKVSDIIFKPNEKDLSGINGTFHTIINEHTHEIRCHCSDITFNDTTGKMILIEDVTEHNEILQELSKKETQYKSIVENSSDFIFICNLQGYFTYVNPQIEKKSEYSSEELIGSHFTKLVRKDYHSKLIGHYQFQFDKKIPSTYIEFPIITKSGQEFWIGQSVDLNIDSDGRVEFFASSRDISERKKFEKALTLSEEKYRSIIENLELGLLEVDRNGVVIKAYPQFCKLTGYSPEDLVGQLPLDILCDEEGKATVLKEQKKRVKGKSSVYELRLRKKDGDFIWVIISGAPYYNERNEVAGTVGIHLDITDRKLMEEELIRAKSLAEQSLKSKDLFVANISHEIRTPLNAIMGLSHLLASSNMTDKQKTFVNAISKSSENLLLIVNDLLDFSKLEAGKMELNNEAYDLRKLLEEVAVLWEVKVEEKGLQFQKRFDIPEGHFIIDSTRFNGILSNLLHNAVKFTEKGNISLYAQKISETNNFSKFIFAVSDTGIGISKTEKEIIFNSFVQADKGTTRKYGGTGLGLSISKNLIELMGGKLRVNSEPNVGSIFEIELTLERSTEQPTAVSHTNFNNQQLENLDILLVEDNHFNQIMAQSILENWNINVTIANDGIQALEKVQNTAFDLILMDIQMPKMDGVKCTWHMRTELNLETPIIALTANAVQKDLVIYKDVGMNGHVLKPFKQESLWNEMVRVLGESANHKKKKNLISTEDNHESTIPVLDLSLLITNCMGDTNFIQKMVQIAVQEMAMKIEEIIHHFNNDNFEQVKEIIHSIKPTIQNTAVPSLLELALRLEKLAVNDNWKKEFNSFIPQLKQLQEELKAHELSHFE